MAFMLCEFFHGSNASGVPNQCQELQTPSPNSSFSHTTERSPFTVPSYICNSQPASASERACVLPCALIKHNMLVRFITDMYFTTFLTLQLQEDQTSSIINFLLEPYPRVCASKEVSLSLSLIHTPTHKHMVVGGTETVGKLCIARINDNFFILIYFIYLI